MALAVPTVGDLERELAGFSARKAPDLGRAAAVLIPLLPRPDGLHLLFTERSAQLKTHAGQISFPGGSIEAGDPTPVHAALREAREEVGLVPEDVRVLGTLDDCPTFVTGFVITPIAGIVKFDPHAEFSYPWRANPGETARLHELPVSGFCDPANLRVEERTVQGFRYELYWYTVNGTVVWGATARIVHQLIELGLGRGPGLGPEEWPLREPKGEKT